VIPGQDPVVEAKHEIVHSEIVAGGRGQSLEREPPIVGDIAGGASLKGRKASDRLAAKGREQAAHAREWIGLPFAAADDGKRIGGEVRVPGQPGIARGAVEEQTMREAFEELAAPDRVRRRHELLNARASA
jgi:hypothetical protein